MMDEENIDPNDIPDDTDDTDGEGQGSPDEQMAAKGMSPDPTHPAHPKNRAVNPAIKQLQDAMLADRSDKGLHDARQTMTQQTRDNALLSSLAKSSAQMGSLGGHVSDSSAVGDMAKGLDQAAQQDYSTQAAEVQKRQALQQYLLGQMQKRDTANNTLDSREGIAANAIEAKKLALDTSESGKDSRTKARVDAYLKTHKGKPVASSTPVGNAPSNVAGTVSNGDPDAVEPGAYDNPKDNAQFTKLNHDMTAGLAARSDFAKNQGVATAASRLLTLGKQGESQKGGLDSRQIHEAAVTSASLVGGGTGAAQSTIEALVPPSNAGSLEARIEEFLTADPQGANQMAFVKRMMETAEREKHLSEQNVNSIKAEIANGGSNLRQKYPKRFKKEIVGFHFGSPDALDATGHYIRKEYGAKPPEPAPASPSGPGMANAAADTAPQDPNTANYAAQHKVDYATAAKIIASRKAAKAAAAQQGGAP